MLSRFLEEYVVSSWSRRCLHSLLLRPWTWLPMRLSTNTSTTTPNCPRQEKRTSQSGMPTRSTRALAATGLWASSAMVPGKTVMLPADMDALPEKELTRLPYASTVTARDTEGNEKPVMHARGHDMHITCLLAAAETLAKLRAEWTRTLIVLFQPDEERENGA
ncbi:hypothetical protein VTO42DRAFT_5903 [Malbranchea cinnamomea]